MSSATDLFLERNHLKNAEVVEIYDPILAYDVVVLSRDQYESLSQTDRSLAVGSKTGATFLARIRRSDQPDFGD